jgi:hypothetical protein
MQANPNNNKLTWLIVWWKVAKKSLRSMMSFWHPSCWLVALHQNKEGLMPHVSCLLEPFDLEIRAPTRVSKRIPTASTQQR